MQDRVLVGPRRFSYACDLFVGQMSDVSVDNRSIPYEMRGWSTPYVTSWVRECVRIIARSCHVPIMITVEACTSRALPDFNICNYTTTFTQIEEDASKKARHQSESH